MQNTWNSIVNNANHAVYQDDGGDEMRDASKPEDEQQPSIQVTAISIP